ncbi:hypothetical protein FAM09_04650 [Niastella caeni]|uniref:Uncharacterized protein n=1 Tax=Niastella caeni TaxID=2569763 RepID=A0A4S8I009_9BACT|nr:hypothetical protein [Niastella caeni]THU41403.1 hypothetical protein FAM09_04650 [Niastella caeni]
MKHIFIGVNSVINQLIVALALTISACLSSISVNAGTISQQPVSQRIEITAYNGHVNTNTTHSNSIPNHPVNQLRIIIPGKV